MFKLMELSDSQLLIRVSIRAQHTHIVGVIRQSAILFAKDRPADVAKQFTALKNLLTTEIPQHFLFEEQEMYPILIDENPSMERAKIVAQFIDDHKTLSEQLQNMAPLVDSQNIDNSPGQVWTVLNNFFTAVTNHFDREDQFISKAY